MLGRSQAPEAELRPRSAFPRATNRVHNGWHVPIGASPYIRTYAHLNVCSYVRTYVSCANRCDVDHMTCVSGKDTHLHALFQRLMEEYEVKFLHAARKDDPDRIPKLSRQNILDLVLQAFRETPMSVALTPGPG